MDGVQAEVKQNCWFLQMMGSYEPQTVSENSFDFSDWLGVEFFSVQSEMKYITQLLYLRKHREQNPSSILIFWRDHPWRFVHFHQRSLGSL